MGIKVSELEEGFEVNLKISSEEKGSSMDMKAVIKSVPRDNIAIIALDYPTDKRLNFDSVDVDMEYVHEDTLPIIWRKVLISYYKGEYILKTPNEGKRNNRRGCFRVGVSTVAAMRMEGRPPTKVMVRDVSLSGFSLTDRKKELDLKVGDRLTVKFEDKGHVINLAGNVVRTEEHEDMIIYGLEICNLCKDLSSYISVRQRQNRS